MGFSIMPGIRVDGPKRKAEPHAAPGMERTRCFQCPAMSCIEQRKRTAPWRFYCEELRREVAPEKVTKAECPRHRLAVSGRRPAERGE